jgi:glutamyl/glutaminyl-tRNA synthetase
LPKKTQPVGKINLIPSVISPFNKTRIAPTPSGFLHLGNILSFILAATLAEKNNAKILLRIDDLDQSRANDLYIEDIFETLNFLEIPWDEGPKTALKFKESYSQVTRLDSYRELLLKLAGNDLVFACGCSRKQQLQAGPCSCLTKNIPLNTENVSWRMKTSGDRMLQIKTVNGKVTGVSLPPSMQNFIVKKRDGMPAYQLTSVVDDLHYGVDFIVRGDDLWSSTLAQMYLADVVGLEDFKDTAFYHHKLILDETGNKLSKSAGSASIHFLRGGNKPVSAIWQIIAKHFGINADVKTWRELGKALLNEATYPI